MIEPRIVRTWDELPPVVFYQGEYFSTRVLEYKHRKMQSALVKILNVPGCECDSYNGHKCLMCQVREIARNGIDD